MKTDPSKVVVPWMEMGVALWMATACSWGGIVTPLYVGNLEPVRDQYGRPLTGSCDSAEAAFRCRLEIRMAADGFIRPPESSGAPHLANPLLFPDSIGGMGMNTAESDCGLFCIAFAERPATGTKFFGRAFNAPTLAEASFYADSAVATAPATASSLLLVFGPAQPLDAGDADGDGLINSWEKALGIDDRPAFDYDGDGMGDHQEMLAGTAPDDPDSRLAFQGIRAEADANPAGVNGAATCAMRVIWQSVPGKSYRLQYAPTLEGMQVFLDVGSVVTAGEGEYVIERVVDISDQPAAGTFRVKLAVPE